MKGACNNTKKHYYEVEPLGVCLVFVEKDRSWLYVCNNMPFYMTETSEQNRQDYF